LGSGTQKTGGLGGLRDRARGSESVAAPFGKNADMDSIPAHEVSEIRFDETVDVVVVGLGVAGTSAVVAARQHGVEVLAVEHGHGPGGTSANSGGLIYLGGGTALQTACGYQDSTENMATFLRSALGPGADDDRVDAYCEGSPDHFDWLVSIGVPFRAAFCVEPNPSTKLPPLCRGGTSPSGSTPLAGFSWSALAPPSRRAPPA
jgi:3-oxo-5alpha-steroid 4-dehydrogenase